MAGAGHGTKSVIAALVANGVIAIAKLVGFVVTRSSSMLAESIHSFADSGNQALLLLGSKRARKRDTPTHPFGYGRERYFWSFVVALVLFALGSVFAIYEGVHKLEHPEPLESPQWAIGILVFAIIAEGFSFRTAVRESRPHKGPGSWRRFIRNAKIPELPVVLLEDLGAMTGLVIAIAAVTTSTVTDDPVWDAIGTISIGVLLGVIAIILIIEMKSLLIGESAGRRRIEAIEGAIGIEPGVRKLLHMQTQHLGPEELLVCAKVEFDHELTLPEVAEAVDRVERNVRANVPAARVMYIEPDVDRTTWQQGSVAEHVPTRGVDPELRARLDAEAQTRRDPRLGPKD